MSEGSTRSSGQDPTVRLRHLVRVVLLLPACAVATPPRDAEPVADECASADRVDTADWLLVDEGAFTLRLRPEYSEVDVRGIDSQVGRWRGPGERSVHSDYGFYSASFDADSTRSVREPIVYCERRVTEAAPQVVLYRTEHGYAAGLYWPRPEGRSIPFGRGLSPNPMALRFTATSPRAEEIPELLAIVRSVRFK